MFVQVKETPVQYTSLGKGGWVEFAHCMVKREVRGVDFKFPE